MRPAALALREKEDLGWAPREAVACVQGPFLQEVHTQCVGQAGKAHSRPITPDLEAMLEGLVAS